jgi:predicted enzyme related to lactoylglutathione lyase
VHGAPSWFELTTPDPQQACQWLGTLFGWTFETMQLGGADYHVIKVKGHEVGGIRKPLPGMPDTPTWSTYVTVADVDQIADAAKKAGGAITIPPTELPGVGRLVQVSHPGTGPLLGFEYIRAFE